MSFDQAIKGVHLAHDRFNIVEAAYTAIRHILQGDREPPIIRFPTGRTDNEGQQIVYELDLTQTLPRGEGVTEDTRLRALQKQLVPWNNHLVEEYERWLHKLAVFATTAVELLQTARDCKSREHPADLLPSRPLQPTDQVPPVPSEATATPGYQV